MYWIRKRYIVGLQSPLHTIHEKHYNIQNTIKVRLRNQNKEQPEMQQSPRSPQLGTTTDRLERKHSNDQGPRQTPPELGRVTCTISSSTCKLVLEVICESRGLSNLTPSRSRLFKLIGRVQGMRWSCSKRLAYFVANIYAKESEKRRQKHGRITMIKKWS